MRFLREFDASDPDPAWCARRLIKFEETLRHLFVDGWIMADAKALAASQGPALAASQGPALAASSQGPALAASQKPVPPLTVTQIVMDQIQDTVTLRYGSRVTTLFGQCNSNEAAVAFRAITQVVEETLDRLRADFHERDVYMAFEAMNLQAWTDAATANAETKKNSLRRKARGLCKVLQVPWKWHDGFRYVLELAKDKYMKRADKKVEDCRKAWLEVLPYAGDFAPVVHFYLAVMDGTGIIERYLGVHASFLQCHTGGPDREMSGVCLEIAKDGLESERDLFIKDAAGSLLLTPFSRVLAGLWVKLHARRFAIYQRAKGKTGKRLEGSLKSVSRAHAEATRILTKAASSSSCAAKSTILPCGIDHKKFMRKVRELPVPTPTKRLKDFKKTTERRQKKKDAVTLWQGFAPGPVKLRPKPGCRAHRHMVGMASSCKASESVAAAGSKWLGKRSHPGRTAGVGAVATAATSRKRKAAAKTQVGTLGELSHRRELGSPALQRWLQAIVHGGRVVTKQGITHEVFPTKDAAELFLADSFKKKHEVMSQALRKACECAATWKEAMKASRKKGCVTISNLRDVQTFLSECLTLPTAGGVHTSFLEKPKLFQGGVGRYGRPLAESKQRRVV